MNSITLSSNNSNITALASLPNYSMKLINILADADISGNEAPYIDAIILLSNKLTIGGLLIFEVFDLKLASEYYLSGAIEESYFMKLIRQHAKSNIANIDKLIVSIKDREDICIKNISAKNYTTKITIERISVT